jgi:hypothetical protein
MQHGILAHYDRVPQRNRFIVYHGIEIATGYANEGILFEQELSAGKMNFNNGFPGIIAYQHIGHLCGIPVHNPAGINSQAAVTDSAKVL